jgi:hypothetical protein
MAPTRWTLRPAAIHSGEFWLTSGDGGDDVVCHARRRRLISHDRVNQDIIRPALRMTKRGNRIADIPAAGGHREIDGRHGGGAEGCAEQCIIGRGARTLACGSLCRPEAGGAAIDRTFRRAGRRSCRQVR